MARLRLNRRKEPRELQLGAGVWCKCRPLGQAHLDRAEANAKAQARALSRTEGLMAEYGFEAADVGALFDLEEDPDLTIGTGIHLFAVELAMLGVVQLGGADDENGHALEDKDTVSRRDISLLFQETVPGTSTSFAAQFIALAGQIPFLEREEGNVSASDPSGVGDPLASAAIAPTSTSPAPKADRSSATD